MFNAFEALGRYAVALFRGGYRTAIVTALALAVATGIAFGTHAVELHYQAQADARVAEIQRQADADVAAAAEQAATVADQQTAHRVGPCLRALALADESIWLYFDGATIEREHPPTAAERKGHIALEREAYGNYVDVRDQCRAVAGRYVQPAAD